MENEKQLYILTKLVTKQIVDLTMYVFTTVSTFYSSNLVTDLGLNARKKQ